MVYQFFLKTEITQGRYKIILNISKDEAFAMRKQIGVQAVRQTHSRSPHYFLVENPKYIKILEKYRKSKSEG